jgi:hypothetical protein
MAKKKSPQETTKDTELSDEDAWYILDTYQI